jgi:hypothetical protein
LENAFSLELCGSFLLFASAFLQRARQFLPGGALVFGGASAFGGTFLPGGALLLTFSVTLPLLVCGL